MLSVLLLLLPPAPTPGVPLLSLPPEIRQAADGNPVPIKPETTAKRVTWKLPAAVWAHASDDGKELLVRAGATGRYVLIAAVPQGEGVYFAECVLIVGQPEPPTPPGPGPAPVDPLVAELQALYAADATADAPKAAAALSKLVMFYGEALDLARSASADTTCGQLIAAIAAARDKLVPAGSLPTLRARLGKEIAKLPAPELTLDNACKAAVVAKYEALAKALGAIK